jgi:hypothetical protein
MDWNIDVPARLMSKNGPAYGYGLAGALEVLDTCVLVELSKIRLPWIGEAKEKASRASPWDTRPYFCPRTDNKLARWRPPYWRSRKKKTTDSGGWSLRKKYPFV